MTKRYLSCRHMILMDLLDHTNASFYICYKFMISLLPIAFSYSNDRFRKMFLNLPAFLLLNRPMRGSLVAMDCPVFKGFPFAFFFTIDYN